MAKKLTETDEIILDLFAQACQHSEGYDHMCISTYEYAQGYLIKKGIIKKSECYRK